MWLKMLARVLTARRDQLLEVSAGRKRRMKRLAHPKPARQPRPITEPPEAIRRTKTRSPGRARVLEASITRTDLTDTHQ